MFSIYDTWVMQCAPVAFWEIFADVAIPQDWRAPIEKAVLDFQFVGLIDGAFEADKKLDMVSRISPRPHGSRHFPFFELPLSGQ